MGIMSFLEVIRDIKDKDKIEYTYRLFRIYGGQTSGYRHQYLRYRFKCPYFAYCALSSNPLIKGKGIPTPMEIFEDECLCHTCIMVCEKCELSVKTWDNYRGTPNYRPMQVHHKNYDTLPNDKSDWYESYGFLCRKCNVQEAWDRRPDEDRNSHNPQSRR